MSSRDAGLDTAMVLAAGLGTRLRPLTDDRPKALVEVGGKALIDHMLDRLAQAGVRRAVVNVHAHADRLIAHLHRRSAPPTIVISDERDADQPLETGGGSSEPPRSWRRSDLGGQHRLRMDRARPPPSTRSPALGIPTRMDSLLLLTETDRALGFDGPETSSWMETGALSPGESPTRPAHLTLTWACTSRGRVWSPLARTRLSVFFPYGWLSRTGSLFGLVLDGDWMHVGDPAARDAAEARLASVADA